MKLPIILSAILFVVATMAIFWVASQSFDAADKTTIIVYIVTALGGLVSAVFVVYGYFVNLSVFKESQKPKLLLQVHNDRRTLEGTSVNVHQTVLQYANLSQNECRGLNLELSLVSDSEVIRIPSLFSNSMNIGPNDSRTRDFPTLVYFRENGIPAAVIKNLEKYKLRAGYSYAIMGEKVSSYYDYAWNPKKEWWYIV
ncbi:hypothetical protein [Billgrantia kenyensis]|uniref:Uncharacterized protein n=1 Tax=Billgrantia kenyensis TaxID=321266 RepID=A0A7V9W411_9GAMM|nr:hypothetical protein [Halomonas kenyensis]MBA2780660.1 hypothetical protein [Halomonas kenyensis]MCG6661208.1 hypothetical protein [Halomonas kenyensis]